MELLGVIVILALLTTIAILGVTKIVKSSKEQLSETQIESIRLAAEMWGEENINELPNNGECTYITLSTLKRFSLLEDNVLDFITNNKMSDNLKIKISATKNKFNNINYIYEVDVNDTEIENCNMFKINMLVTGQEFNAKVKTLANESEKAYTDSDTVITNLEFYSYGKLPIGYTKETLTNLSSVDVSVDQDNSIMAYYDGGGKIYIYSENNIYGNTDSSSLFINLKKLTNLDLKNLDVSQVTNMASLFENCVLLNSIDLSDWNTSRVENMYSMFYNCSSLVVIDVSKLNTRKVLDMQYMFWGCTSLKILDLSNWNTENVTMMKAMFAGSSSTGNMTLEKIIGIEKFNTKNVKNMQAMFQRCVNLTELNVSNWDTSNVENMHGLFYGCTSLITLDLTNWNTKKVTTMIAMFQNTTNLTCIKVGKNWQVAEAVDDMFTGSGTSTTTTDECIVTTN